jgi:hypothetical protein
MAKRRCKDPNDMGWPISVVMFIGVVGCFLAVYIFDLVRNFFF